MIIIPIIIIPIIIWTVGTVTWILSRVFEKVRKYEYLVYSTTNLCLMLNYASIERVAMTIVFCTFFLVVVRRIKDEL